MPSVEQGYRGQVLQDTRFAGLAVAQFADTLDSSVQGGVNPLGLVSTLRAKKAAFGAVQELYTAASQGRPLALTRGDGPEEQEFRTDFTTCAQAPPAETVARLTAALETSALESRREPRVLTLASGAQACLLDNFLVHSLLLPSRVQRDWRQKETNTLMPVW